MTLDGFRDPALPVFLVLLSGWFGAMIVGELVTTRIQRWRARRRGYRYVIK